MPGRWQKYKSDASVAVTITGTAYKDHTFEFTVKSGKAAGVESESSRPGQALASTVTLKQIYEIAKGLVVLCGLNMNPLTITTRMAPS